MSAAANGQATSAPTTCSRSRSRRRARRSGGLGRRRHLTGAIVALLGLPLLTLLLDSMRDTFSLESQVLLYLLAVVVRRGGRRDGGGACERASPPPSSSTTTSSSRSTRSRWPRASRRWRWRVPRRRGGGERAVERPRGARRAAEQAGSRRRRCRASPAAISSEGETLHQILERAREHVRDGVGHAQAPASTRPVTGSTSDNAGWAPPGEEAPLRFDVPIGTELRLIGRGPAAVRRGPARPAGVRRGGADRLRGPAAQRSAPARRASSRRRTASGPRCSPRWATTCARRWPGSRRRSSTLRQTDVSWSERGAGRAAGDDRGVRRPARRDRREPARREPARGRRAQRAGRARGARRGDRRRAPRRARRARARGGRRAGGSAARPGRPGLLERVLANLLENALRHGRGGPVEVSATAGRDGGAREGGGPRPGRPEAQREQLFQPFQRLEDGASQGRRARADRRARVHGGDGRRADRGRLGGRRPDDAAATAARANDARSRGRGRAGRSARRWRSTSARGTTT